MDNHIVSEHKDSQKEKTPGEKSKERADELKAAYYSQISSYKQTISHKDLASLLEDEKAAQEAAIVEELNRTLAIVHTSSTYILIEKNETDFVLDSKTSLLTLYENQIVPEIFGKHKGRSLTKACPSCGSA